MIANTYFVAALSVAVLSATVKAAIAHQISGLPTIAVYGERLNFTFAPLQFDSFNGTNLKVAVRKEAYKPRMGFFFGGKKAEEVEMCINPTTESKPETRTVAVSCELSKTYTNDNRKLRVMVEDAGQRYESLPFLGKFAGPTAAEQTKQKAQEEAQKTEKIAQEKIEEASESASDAAKAGEETAASLKEKASSMAGTVGDKLVEAKDAVKDTSKNAFHSIVETAKNVDEKLQDDEQEVSLEDVAPSVPDDKKPGAASSLSTSFLLTFTTIGVATIFTLLL